MHEADYVTGDYTLTRFLFFLLTCLYGAINYLGGNDLYSQDYDYLLLECGFLAALLLTRNMQRWIFARHVLSFCLFRFCFTTMVRYFTV